MRRQSGIQTKKKELQEQEEAYSKFLGLKASIGAVYQNLNLIKTKESAALYSEETIKKIHDTWLLAILQNAFDEEREFLRNNKEFWKALGLIQTRFESTPELTDLINSVIYVQHEYIDNFIDKAPPEGITLAQLEDWAKQMDKKFYSFDQDKLNPLLSSILKYLTNEINKSRSELRQMEDVKAKSWWQFWRR
jgi:hypothetical protein